jgi:prevent-host-death family protein
MIQANVAELKNHLSEYLQRVEAGQCVEICRRNVPMARITAVRHRTANLTVLGGGRGTVEIACDLTEPAIGLDNWMMMEP